MGISKTQQYSQKTLANSKIGMAVAHPARIEILKAIRAKEFVTNQEMSKQLKLSVSTIHEHVRKLIDAELVSTEYFEKYGMIRRLEKHEEKIKPYCEE